MSVDAIANYMPLISLCLKAGRTGDSREIFLEAMAIQGREAVTEDEGRERLTRERLTA